MRIQCEKCGRVTTKYIVDDFGLVKSLKSSHRGTKIIKGALSMCITCERCGKLTRHYQTLAKGKKVCADDRNCWPMEKKYTSPPHLIKQLNTLQARWTQ